jgi:hypothetical protein
MDRKGNLPAQRHGHPSDPHGNGIAPEKYAFVQGLHRCPRIKAKRTQPVAFAFGNGCPVNGRNTRNGADGECIEIHSALLQIIRNKGKRRII